MMSGRLAWPFQVTLARSALRGASLAWAESFDGTAAGRRRGRPDATTDWAFPLAGHQRRRAGDGGSALAAPSSDIPGRPLRR
jgi:hypothetical protein